MKKKYIVELDEGAIEFAKNFFKEECEDFDVPIVSAIANATPYNPTGDCISREALKEQINATDFDFGDYYDNTEEIRKRVCEAIDNAQAVDLWQMRQEATENALKKAREEDKWGKWVITEIQCPNCLEFFDTICYSSEELNKCPSCGATMKGGAE